MTLWRWQEWTPSLGCREEGTSHRSPLFLQFFASMLTYPFVLVSNLMAVNNCGLAGGLLPYAPTYSSWLDCWSQLHREGNMSRGNSLFFRKVPAGKRYVWEERRFR